MSARHNQHWVSRDRGLGEGVTDTEGPEPCGPGLSEVQHPFTVSQCAYFITSLRSFDDICTSLSSSTQHPPLPK